MRISLLFGNCIVTFPSVVDTKFSAAAMALNGFGVTMSTFVRNRARFHNLIVFTEFSRPPPMYYVLTTRWGSPKIFQNFSFTLSLSLSSLYPPLSEFDLVPHAPQAADHLIVWPQILSHFFARILEYILLISINMMKVCVRTCACSEITSGRHGWNLRHHHLRRRTHYILCTHTAE